jgi:hypothetical protein
MLAKDSQKSILILVGLSIVSTLTWSSEKNAVSQKNIKESTVEICKVAEHFPGGKYQYKSKSEIDEDFIDEQSLCNLNYQINSGKNSVAVCPKLHGLSPALNFFEIPDGMSKQILEGNLCEVKDFKLEKIAKFKVTEPSGCSSTSSILGYYHLSRILGDILHIPVSVSKTIDVEYFKKNVDAAHLATKEKSKKTFNTWNKVSKALLPTANPYNKSKLLTNDGKHVYGAMSKVMKKEKPYHEFDVASRVRIWEQFKNTNPYYKLLMIHQPIHEIIPNQFTRENVQNLVAMRDTSNMLLMDYLMSQHDRLDNISYKEKYYWQEVLDHGGYRIKRDKPLKLSAKLIKKLKPLIIKEMALKDNDCGVAYSNDVKKNKLLLSTAHMDPKTYHRLLWFRSIIDQKETESFFQDELIFSDAEWKNFRKNVVDIASFLENKCKREELRLDLELDYFESQNLKKTTTDCSIVKNYADKNDAK